MSRRSTTFAGVLLVAFAGACGDNQKSVALEDLPPKLAEATCTAAKKCYGIAYDLFLNGADCAAVTEQRIRNTTYARLQGEIDKGKVVYHGDKVQACLDELAARTCAETLERDSPTCLAALDGTVALGGDCDLNEDCQGKALCKSSSGICPGQCSPLLVAGQPCDQDGDCQDGLQCSSETKLCVEPSSAGQPCEYGAAPCGPGLLCLGKDDNNKTPGTCKTSTEAFSAAVDASCDVGNGVLCQSGSSCVAEGIDVASLSVTWQCVATGSYSASGACKPGFPEACAAGNYCKTGSGVSALNGACTAIPASGQPCGNGMSQCQATAVCVSGTCQNLVANGVSCSADAMCYSGYCDPSGGCAARLPCK